MVGATAFWLLSFWYIGIVVLGLIILMVLSDLDTGSYETFIGVGILGLFVFLVWGKVSIISALVGSLYYVIAGAIWALINYTRVIRTAMKRDKESGNLLSLSYYNGLILQNRIVRWIAYWPLSIINYFIGHFIFEFFSWLADTLEGSFKKITELIYNRIKGS